ncbi:oligosaccharide MFS transporter [Krasilnikoviella flava]|uniref:MFS transporter, OHS family, lactose permease n=1 Tax=Krasilnikoviella flava TaxID=526729 RepID=A0A1T5LFA8_9MICO|nr:oligosaccharide MFS transporter [Krasilnikoviella flava]SKC74681.1 MFS transporter, OHS family, lactose permease [Krasilnikoviella flava]
MSITTATPDGATAKPRARDSLKKLAFWNFGGLFFFYFAIWQLAFTFLSRWLETEAGMSHGNIGLLNSVMAFTAFCLQPFYGFIQDKLGFRKNLFAFVVLVGAMMGPFFAFVFTPIVNANQVLGAVVGGVFLSLTLNAGVGIVETFNERNARANGFEYGHVRLFGSVAGATASLVGGFIWASNPDNIWWAGTFSAIVLGVLLFVARTPKPGEPGYAAASGDAAGEARTKVTLATVRQLLTNRSFVGFMVLMFGTAALYDVFDQQFPNYFAQFVTGGIDSQVLFSRVVFVQILLEAVVMIATPFLINRIGAKNGLLLFGLVLVVRVLGSAFFTSTEMLIVWRLLAAIEMPLMLISVMKYLTRMFDVRISATAYMLGFNMAKQIGIVIFSWAFGAAYDTIGFGNSYIVMGVVVVVVTVVASVLMRDDRRHALSDGSAPEAVPDR